MEANATKDLKATEFDRALFTKVFSNNGRFSWSGDYKKQYIYRLKSVNDLKQTELPENIIQKESDTILDEVLKYDPDLSIFKLFHKHFEFYARKAVEIYRLDLSAEERAALKKSTMKAYDLHDYGDWTSVGVETDGERISFVLAKASQQSTITSLSQSNLSDEVWEKVKDAALDKLNSNGSNLVSVSAKVVTPKRMIIKITFDTGEGFVDIGTDDFSVDEQGKRIKDASALVERKNAVMSVVDSLPLSRETRSKIKNSLETGESTVFTKDTLLKMSDLREKDIILIPTTQSFDREDEIVPESSERVVSTLYKQKISEILSKAREYYEKNSSLEGFFQAHGEHSTNSAKITAELLDDENAERMGYHAYIILVRDASDYEKAIKVPGPLSGKVIDSVSVDFDYRDSNMDIRNSKYSKEIYDVIVSKIRQFSRQ